MIRNLIAAMKIKKGSKVERNMKERNILQIDLSIFDLHLSNTNKFVVERPGTNYEFYGKAA